MVGKRWQESGPHLLSLAHHHTGGPEFNGMGFFSMERFSKYIDSNMEYGMAAPTGLQDPQLDRGHIRTPSTDPGTQEMDKELYDARMSQQAVSSRHWRYVSRGQTTT